MNALVIPTLLADEIRLLFSDAPEESAGILFCHAAKGIETVKLLAAEFSAYSKEDYLVRSGDRIVIDPIAVNNRIQRARRDGLSMVQVHTHPLSEHAEFSNIDTLGEAEMLPVICRRVPERHHGTLVLGKISSSARIYSDEKAFSAARIIEVGTRIERLDKVAFQPKERYTRSYLALGRDEHASLQDLRVCIVGLGGLGSLVAEQLSYLGVKSVLMIDPDKLEESNLNRVAGALPEDVGKQKVDVAADRYRAVMPSATVKAISGSVLDESAARAILDYDLTFCCTDSHGSRAVLNWISYQYLVPTIDTGVEISLNNDMSIAAIAGRVQLIGPGMPCLHCCDTLDANRIREDLMTTEERERDQYVSGQRIHQPAVITLNGVVASLATTMLLGISTGLPINARMQTYDAIRGQVRAAESTTKAGCPICSVDSTIGGLGDAVTSIWRRAS
jgi:molybdopterin-synthase adenylyltransferase